MTTFTVEYRKTGYALADAFRPDPMWGRKIYTVDGDKIGSNDPVEIRKAARQTAPDGYEIHSVMPSNAAVKGGAQQRQTRGTAHGRRPF